jgi:dipeptidyl aminopeptidase/acylaminoacyl peptidase
MPWDGTNLWKARIGEDGALEREKLVAGGPAESVVQPVWSADGVLHFISDSSGWWNLYREEEDGPAALCPTEAEFCGPPWTLGASNYTFTQSGVLFCTYKTQGRWSLAQLEPDGHLVDIPTGMSDLGSLVAQGEDLYFIGASPEDAAAVCVLRQGARKTEILKSSSKIELPKTLLSKPQTIRFMTDGHREAFALYYPPTNPDFTGPEEEKPPLLVTSHVGPTASASSSRNLSLQFWTSRGFAVVDVDYGGSTGYGRLYRERLKGQWGVVDVEDCVHAASYLVKQGLADPNRLAIRGGSAGGFTTLAALAFRDFFHAGASYYGISDLEAISRDTHKFESRYVDSLVAPLSGGLDTLRRRSPIHGVDGLSCPVIFFQGLLDPVVPPDQSERMYRALREKGIPTAYLTFEGEYHGLRKPENAVRACLAELAFYGRIFGFKPADQTGVLRIENLDQHDTTSA